MNRFALLFGTCGFVLASTTYRSAQAEEPVRPGPRATIAIPEKTPANLPARAEAPPRDWYGWQTLIVDASALTLASVGWLTDTTALTGAGVGAYLLGAPVVHAANGSVGKAFVSLGVRAGALPSFLFVGVMTGLFVCPKSETDWDDLRHCLRDAYAVGVLAGAVSAVAIDATTFARKGARLRPPPFVAPFALPAAGGMTLGVTGAF